MGTAGLGTTLVFALVAILWLAYLVPVWARRREYAATELNAVRLQQTLRVMAETAEVPEALRIEASARAVARQQKVFAKEQRLQAAIERAKAVQKARELDQQIRQVEREVRAAVASSHTRSQRLRRTRLACAVMLMLSIGAVVAGMAVPGMVPLAVVGTVTATLVCVGLVSLARIGARMRAVEIEAERRVISDAMRRGEQPAVVEDRTWTPVKLPKPMTSLRPAPYVEDPMTRLRAYAAQRVAEDEAMAAERAAEAAERAAQIAPVIPLRPMVPVAPERTAAEAFLARRAARPAPAASFDQLLSGEIEIAEAERRAARAMAATDRLERAGVAPSRFANLGRIDESQEDSLDVRAVFARRAAS